MDTFIFKNASLVNEGSIKTSDVLVKKGRIERIDPEISSYRAANREIRADGLHLFPGMIDDQVHFREPGLTEKGDIHAESRAAAAGGITSFMDMPNTVPNTLTQELLADKYRIAEKESLVNYSFYMGVSNSNAEEVLATSIADVCGLKIFMGSSTGNMLVDNEETLHKIFSESEMLIAVHCEDEATIAQNLAEAKGRFPRGIPPYMHAQIRSEEACYISSSFAVGLAKKTCARLHVLHISTARELALFEPGNEIDKKRITAEACIHHLFFSDEDYDRLGNRIKWNPAVKAASDRAGLWDALVTGRIDVIATDHAPHQDAEKKQDYLKCPSGGPMVQHALPALFELYHQGHIRLQDIAHRTAHQVARCFKVSERGFIREGYFADLVLVNLNRGFKVTRENILYKCGWSSFEGSDFSSSIEKTFVNGQPVYENGEVLRVASPAARLRFGQVHGY